MAVTAADLTYPPGGTGELHPEWWPDGALPGLLAVWLTAGEGQLPDDATEAQGDAVTLAYAYWLAYADKVLSMAATPNSVSVDRGDISVSYAADQRKLFSLRMQYWLDQFNTAVAAVGEVTPPTTYTTPRTSFSQPIVRSF